MTNETRPLEATVHDPDAFLLCLVLGTLEAMRGGEWPLEAGIWCLSRPAFWQPLAPAGVSGEIIAVLRSADELSALAKLSGRAAANAELDRMIGLVRARLAASPDHSWHLRWSGEVGS